MMRIICLGNRMVPRVSAGPRVLEVLRSRPVEEGFRVFDGGLAGLSLVPLIRGAERVVIVDSARGLARPGQSIVLAREEAAACAVRRLAHGDGLARLLDALPHVLRARIPEILVLGVEEPATEAAIRDAAQTAVSLILDGVAA